ncbi:hypothetical protein J0H58_02900 [bacterium]|mgnify:CR=1 FL=1|nr:hypothetical protein [bacterium]
MPPSEFWRADTWSATDAYEGYLMSKGALKPENKPWTQEELDEIDRMIEEDATRTARREGKA